MIQSSIINREYRPYDNDHQVSLSDPNGLNILLAGNNNPFVRTKIVTIKSEPFIIEIKDPLLNTYTTHIMVVVEYDNSTYLTNYMECFLVEQKEDTTDISFTPNATVLLNPIIMEEIILEPLEPKSKVCLESMALGALESYFTITSSMNSSNVLHYVKLCTSLNHEPSDLILEYIMLHYSHLVKDGKLIKLY